MGWLPCPILPKRQWPAVRYKEKRAITREEHLAILQRERNDERRAFYEMCWHLGGSQSDIAALKVEDVDWDDQVISFFRKKTKSVQIIHFGDEVAAILNRLPDRGPLFPNFGLLDEKHRASWFQMICRRTGIIGVSLHSYRYAWAERAKTCGYPERFAQEALGHNSKAIHRAYARKARVKLKSSLSRSSGEWRRIKRLWRYTPDAREGLDWPGRPVRLRAFLRRQWALIASVAFANHFPSLRNAVRVAVRKNFGVLAGG
jgi:integrase